MQRSPAKNRASFSAWLPATSALTGKGNLSHVLSLCSPLALGPSARSASDCAAGKITTRKLSVASKALAFCLGRFHGPMALRL